MDPGTLLGPYEILSLLGAGGMGEVYKARDTRLDRIVAVKVLAAHLSEQPGGSERLEREARAISGLNHPHICTLHDIGHEKGIDFLVMEYLEGETLAARLGRGPLPLHQALALGIQIAEALERAHRQGIVHRDLKPANVMLTKNGAMPHAKLLDFGLAKLEQRQAVVYAGSMVATAAPVADLTAKGTIVGTLQYMSPEQLEGAEVDSRTDVFAFGELVYEMVTGQKAFQGKSQPSLISAIMSTDPPPISSVQSMSPPALDHVVKTCLAKDPADRWQTLHDVVVQLKWIAEGGSQVGLPAQVVAKRRTRDKALMIALAAAAILLGALSVPALLYFREAPPLEEIRFTVETPPATNPTFFALSPDGRQIVFQAAGPSGVSTLYLRRLDSTTLQNLPGTDGGGWPFWSPDSRYVGFVAGTKLKRIDVNGGQPQELAEGGTASTWSSEGTILFSHGGGLQAISVSGGEPRPIAVGTPVPALFPQFLPDGNHFVYTAPAAEPPGIYVASLDSAEASLLIPTASSAIYIDPGFLLFHRQGTVFAQPFSPTRLEVSGEPVRVVDDVLVSGAGRAALAVSRSGTLVYRSIEASMQQFSWYDRTGKALGSIGKPDAYSQNFDLSPDGTEVALSIYDESGILKIWLMDWARGVTTPFTFTQTGRDVIWSPDGSRLAYTRDRGLGTGVDIVMRGAGGLGEEQVLVAGPTPDYVEDWSKDGRYIAYCRPGSAGAGVDIWAMPLFGDRKPFLVVESPFAKDEPHFSFDGKWLAYNSTESGISQIYVISFPAMDQKRQISDTGGAQPRWHRSGTELYYLSPDGKMMAVNISAGEKLDSGVPRPLFETTLPVSITTDQYAVTADGQRFLLLKPTSETVGAPLSMIVNWTHILRP